MSRDLGLLLLRVAPGLMMAFGHGYGKVMSLVQGRVEFGDPIGIGPLPSLILAAFAEFVCSLLVVLGAGTRLAAVPVVVTMLVAAFVVHADDPWQRQEFALLYAVPFLTLVFTGGGRYALETWFRRKRR